jgi:hypothetical protein
MSASASDLYDFLSDCRVPARDICSLAHDELRPGRLPPLRHCEARYQRGETIHQQAPHPLLDCFVTTLLAMTEWMIPLRFIAI